MNMGDVKFWHSCFDALILALGPRPVAMVPQIEMFNVKDT